MRITHISRSLCPRMVKLAQAQQDTGHTTHWIGERHPSFQHTLPFSTYQIIDEIRFGGLVKSIHSMEPHTDIFHVHTHLTDVYLYEKSIEYSKLTPVLWDCHDDPGNQSNHLRIGAVTRLGGSPFRFYSTYCPKAWFQPSRLFTAGIVIATGLSNVPGHFRYWLGMFKEMQSLGLPLTCFTQSEILDEYKSVARMETAIDVRQLIETMSRFTVGLCGSPHPDANMLSAMPNKLFEYVAAGIPVICFGKKHEMAEFIEEHGIGASIDSPQEFPDVLKSIHSCREKVLEVRDKFCMENELPKVLWFYEECIQAFRSSPTQNMVG